MPIHSERKRHFLVRNKKRLIADILISTALIVFCAALCEVLLYISVLPLAFLMIMAGAYMTAKYGLGGMVYAIGLFLAVWLLMGSKTLVLNCLLVFPVMLASGYVIKKQYPFYEALAYTAVVFLFGIVFAVIYGQMTTGKELGSYVLYVLAENTLIPTVGIAFLYPMLLMVKGGYAVPETEEILKMLVDIDAVKVEILLPENQELLSQHFGMMTPVMAIYSVILGTLGLYTLVRMMVKKSGQAVCPAPAFSEFDYGKKVGNVLFWTYIVSVFVGVLDIKNMEMFSAVISTATTLLFAVQGYSFINWVARRYMGKAPAGFITILAAALFGNMVGYLGMMEHMIRLREIARSGPGDQF